MHTYNVFKAEKILRNIFKGMSFKVFADDGGESSPTPAAPEAPQISYEQLIAQARKEEKDKLYPRIKKAEDDNKTLLTANNDLLLKNAALQQEYDKLKNKGSEEINTKVKELEEKIKTLTTENEELKKNTPDEAKIREKIEQEYKVKDYIRTKLEENKDNILSILVADVKGSSTEEIDKAIEAAKEKTLSIKKDLGLVDDSGKPKDTGNKDDKPAPPPVANPSNSTPKNFDMEYFRSLDPSSKEYAEYRKKLKLK